KVAVIGIGPLGYDIVKDLAISKEFAKDDNQRQAKKLYSVASHPSKLGWDFRDPKAPSWTKLIEVFQGLIGLRIIRLIIRLELLQQGGQAPKEFDVENGLLDKIGEGGEKTETKAPKKKGKEVGLKLIERIKYKQTGKDKDFYPTTLTSFEPEAVDGIVPPSGPGTQSTISPSDFRTKTSILTSLIKLKPLIKLP
ncbi:hypothetical protein PPACK8108_LOCUS14976, partial [Phakopsora pachyrhizi]